MRKSRELCRDRRVDFRNAMPEEVAPECGRPVEQPPAAIVYEIVPLSAHDDEGIGRQVLTHLRKRMPDMLRIPAANIVSGWRQEGQTPFLRDA